MKFFNNDRLLKALKNQPVDATPVWLMRQAGRYLPEYRALRAEAGDFMTLCKTPELAAQVTLQPLQRFDLDAAILFSDILTIPDAMGLGLHFVSGEGPTFSQPVRTREQIAGLKIPDPVIDLAYVQQTIRLVKQALASRVPLIGFCGSPWTLATYMIEGKSSRDFALIQKMRREQPQLLHTLLSILAQAVSVHLAEQINSGVDVVMIFDTWGGVLETAAFQEFSLRYLQMIVTQLKTISPTPIILFTKGSNAWLELLAETGCDAVSLDAEVDLHSARTRVDSRVALQGNFDPQKLYLSPEKIRAEVLRILESYGHGSGHIFNLGHGVPPDVAPENIATLIDAVHELSRPFHEKAVTCHHEPFAKSTRG